MTPPTVRRRNATTGGRDPTRSVVLRREYAAAASKRFRYVKGAIRDGVQGADVLGIGRDPPSRPVLLQEGPEVRRTLNSLRRQIRPLQRQLATASGAAAERIKDRMRTLAREFINVPGRFAFSTDVAKMEAFGGWLDEMTDAAVMEVARGPGGGVIAEGGWQQTYVRRAYVKGYSHAQMNLAAAGADVPARVDDVARQVALPVHADALELLFARNLEELKGIDAATGQAIRRELAEGFARGLNPKRTASIMNGRIDAIGINRARTMARTETIRAHAKATLNRYRQFGVGQVQGVAEFATAGDDRVCPICIGLEGEIFTLKEAESVIPVHPNCRCTWLPVIDKDQLRNQGITRNSARVRRVIRQVREIQRETFPAWLQTEAMAA